MQLNNNNSKKMGLRKKRGKSLENVREKRKGLRSMCQRRSSGEKYMRRSGSVDCFL
jgi:hypothetical protein